MPLTHEMPARVQALESGALVVPVGWVPVEAPAFAAGDRVRVVVTITVVEADAT